MKDIFDRKLAEKINEELSAYREPFQQDDWVRMKGRMEMHQQSLGFWLARAFALLLFVASVSAYFLYEQPFSLLSPKPYGLLIEGTKSYEIDNIASFEPKIYYDQSLDLPFYSKLPSTPSFPIQSPEGHSSAVQPSSDNAPPLNQTNIAVGGAENGKTLASVLMTNVKAKEEHTANRSLSEHSISSTDLSLLSVTDIFLPNLDTRFRHYYTPAIFKPRRKFHWENISLHAQVQRYFDQELSMTESTPGFGLMNSFRYGKSLSIQIGGHFAVQHAHSLGETIDKQGSRPRQEQIRSTQAIIQTLDVPLHFQWSTVPKGRQSRLNFGIGFSNLFLIKETYQVEDFDNRNNVRIAQSESGEMNYYGKSFSDVSWLNSLNLSFGIEKRITQKSTLTFEPFLQLPLKKAGRQNVEFRNVGARFKINFWNSRQP